MTQMRQKHIFRGAAINSSENLHSHKVMPHAFFFFMFLFLQCFLISQKGNKSDQARTWGMSSLKKP